MTLTTTILVILSAVLVNNYIFSKFLGLCPYVGVSKDRQSAIGMGLAVIFVMTLASVASWAIYHYFLFPSQANILHKIFGGDLKNYDLTYLRTLNIDGLTINGVQLGYGQAGSFMFAVVQGFGAGVGFTLALVLMAGIRERLELADVPKPLQGMPIAFITAGLLAIAFMGFIGLVK